MKLISNFSILLSAVFFVLIQTATAKKNVCESPHHCETCSKSTRGPSGSANTCYMQTPQKVDHRQIGAEQELFFTHDLSPGSFFWYPHGTIIYNRLCDFIRKQYRKRGFVEVITPNLYSAKLWETSGHWAKYREEMFTFTSERENFGLKPMNCPSHALMFAQKPRNYDELPIRFADFGVVHRNERSERSLKDGLSRVRRFQQDDGTIFCRRDQVRKEIMGSLDFLAYVYEEVFHIPYSLHLSTRPKNFIGKVLDWDVAEEALRQALEDFGRPWSLEPGEGAFYGPKIDVVLLQKHQCATIQLDFQMPRRFGLQYTDKNGTQSHPVMIHRTVLGSVERITAVLTEFYVGKWPFWLSPRQAKVISINSSNSAYAHEVKEKIYKAGFEVEYEDFEDINEQISNNKLKDFNLVLVIGERERENGSVNVRTREKTPLGEVLVDVLIERFHYFSHNHTSDHEILTHFSNP